MIYFIKRMQYYYEFAVVVEITFNYHDDYFTVSKVPQAPTVKPGMSTQISPPGAVPDAPELVVAHVATFSPSPREAA